MSVYGNPLPEPVPDLEHSSLTGLLKVARTVIGTSSDPDTVRRWRAVSDELLDHLAHYRERAESARYERDECPEDYACRHDVRVSQLSGNQICGVCAVPLSPSPQERQ